MIQNKAEYHEALQRLKDQALRIKERDKMLQAKELSTAEIKRVLDPIRSFHESLQEDVMSYEQLLQIEFDAIRESDDSV